MDVEPQSLQTIGFALAAAIAKDDASAAMMAVRSQAPMSLLLISI
ncbi:MAG TPA: hypothetical protein VGO04_24465 [Ensifer sp.]|jgi:hypothetical protein|nr:hypothetical protein [Ensifer sp.]